MVARIEQNQGNGHACVKCGSIFSFDLLNFCESCDRQMICRACISTDHGEHVTQSMTRFLETCQKKLDSWREIFMKTAVDGLQKQLDAVINEIRNVTAKELVITGRFET